MKKLIIICLFILAIPVLTGCDKAKDNAGAAFKDSSPAPKASVAAKPAKEEAATENGKPFEYKEPDHAFFKVANHKKEYLPEERTEELITLPNDMAVVRHITYKRPGLTLHPLTEKEIASGKQLVFSTIALVDKKTNTEKEIKYNYGTDDDCVPPIIDAMISNDLSEFRCIGATDTNVFVSFSAINGSDAETNTAGVSVVPSYYCDYSEVCFVTPSVVRVKVEVPEEKLNKKLSSINGIEYYIEVYKSKDDSGKVKEILGHRHVWYNKKHYDFFSGITTIDSSGYFPLEIVKRGDYKDMPLPEFDMSEWKGWTRMNFDRKNLIK